MLWPALWTGWPTPLRSVTHLTCSPILHSVWWSCHHRYSGYALYTASHHMEHARKLEDILNQLHLHWHCKTLFTGILLGIVWAICLMSSQGIAAAGKGAIGMALCWGLLAHSPIRTPSSFVHTCTHVPANYAYIFQVSHSLT